MLIIKVNLVLILYFTTTESEIIQNLDKNLKNRVIINSIRNNKMVEVIIKADDGQTESLILPRVRSKGPQLNTTNALYTALSCIIGYSTMNSIHDFIKWSPLTYQHKFLDYNELVYTEEYRPTFERYFKRFVFSISEKANRFINVLNNILNTKSNSSYYRDKSILEALISLQMKTFFITPNTREIDDIRLRHYNIIRLVLDDTVEIQRSLSRNCNAVAPDSANSQFYDLYIEMIEKKRVKINNFFDACTKNLALEKYPKEKCSPTQILLRDFITLPPKDNFSIEIAGTSVVITKGALETDRVTTIEDIDGRMNMSYDSELIFLYQDSVITATMKIILREILIGLKQDESYMKNISNKIDDIYDIISNDNTNFPECLVDGFTILHKFKANDSNIDQNVVQNFYDSLANVDLITEPVQTEGTTYIKEILDNVIKNINNLKCFQESYKLLRDKYSKHYIPFNNPKKALLLDSGVENVEHFRTVCDFSVNVYSTCFLAIMFLHEIDDPFYMEIKGNEKFDNRLYKVLNTIQHYFLLIIKKGSDDVDILKMAYNITPMLINILRKSKDEIKIEIKGVLQKIMADLNSIGMQYCPSSKSNFLLFNQMNFYDLGNKELVNKSMEHFYQHCVKNFDKSDLHESSIDPTEFNYLSVDYLYTHFVKDSEVVKDYEKTVKFYWYGQIKSIHDIYQDTDLLLTKSHDIYALHDIYFKFYIVALYYEIKEIISSNSFPKIKKGFKRILQMCKLQHIFFPEGLQFFILDINTLLAIPVNQNISERKKVKSQIKELESKIDRQLKQYNIVLFKKNKICDFFVKNSCFSFYNFLSSLKTELSENVKNFYDNLKQINIKN